MKQVEEAEIAKFTPQEQRSTKPAKWHIAILKIRLIPPREKGKKKDLLKEWKRD